MSPGEGTKAKVKEADEVKIQSLPAVAMFRQWLDDVRDAVVAASGRSNSAFLWILRVEEPNMTFEQLADSGDFESLDMKLLLALQRRLSGGLQRKVASLKAEMAKKRQMLNGRQVLHIIIQWYAVTEVTGAVYDLTHLLETKMKNNNLDLFMHEWNMVLMHIGIEPQEALKESLFLAQVEKHPGLEIDMAMYRRLPVGHRDRCYEKLYALVEAYLERVRLDNARAELERRQRHMITPASERPQDGKPPKNACHKFWNTGKCPNGSSCSYNHIKNPDLRSATPRGERDKNRTKGDKTNCRDFARNGKCERGDRCRFKHVAACADFAAGKCRKGANCDLCHISSRVSYSRSRSHSRSRSSSSRSGSRDRDRGSSRRGGRDRARSRNGSEKTHRTPTPAPPSREQRRKAGSRNGSRDSSRGRRRSNSNGRAAPAATKTEGSRGRSNEKGSENSRNGGRKRSGSRSKSGERKKVAAARICYASSRDRPSSSRPRPALKRKHSSRRNKLRVTWKDDVCRGRSVAHNIWLLYDAFWRNPLDSCWGERKWHEVRHRKKEALGPAPCFSVLPALV